MKSLSLLTFFVRLRSNWAQRRSLIMATGLLLLAAIVGWQLSARFVAAAKSRPAVLTASAAVAPEAGNMCCGTWAQKATTGPSQRYRDAMAYASSCNRVVLFGGLGNGPNPAGALDDTWEWNGATMTWTQFSPAVKPPARGGHTMAYDSARNRVVLFGGLTGSFSVFNDTWEYNCATHTWTQMNPANSPPGRFGHAMAYDPNLGVTVINGGQSTNQDTWTWNGTNWTQVAGGNQPGIRYDHGMAFDGLRVILFGGNKNAGFAANDTWGFTGTAWTQLAVTGPLQGERLGLAQDPSAGRVILFGGSNSTSNYTNDTWEWDGANLTWCQATLTAPQPAGREYPSMAFDGRGVIFHAGLNSSPTPQSDTWRYQGSRTYTYRAGLMDSFAPPTDATSVASLFATNINSFYGNPAIRNFDDSTTDKFFLQSFTSLPSNIVSAELEVQMRPENGGTSNDSIHFDFPPFNAPSFTWGQNIRVLHPSTTWDFGQGPYVFKLDLANLPAGGTGQPTNLLSLMNSTHSLHVMIQDDTNVDYIKLRVVTCPPRKFFFGLPHDVLGQAQVASDANNNLVISNIGAGGADGVRIDLGEVTGWDGRWQDVNTGALPIGAFLQTALYGTVDNLSNTTIGSTQVVKTAEGANLFTSFAGLGATTLRYNFYRQGQFVGEVINQPANQPAAIISGGPSWTTDAHYSLSGSVPASQEGGQPCTGPGYPCLFAGYTFSVNNAAFIRVGGVTAQVDELRVYPQNSTAASVGGKLSVDLKLANIPTLTVTDQAIRLGRPIRALGTAFFEPFANGLAVSGMGSSGQDGAQIDLGKAENYTVSVDTIDPMGIAPIGTALTVSTTLVSTVLPPPPPVDDSITLTRVRPDDSLPTGILEIGADFSQLGANSMRVTAFNGATQVADITNFTGKVLTSAWPVAIGKTGSVSLGYKLDFPSGTLAAFRPCSPPCDQQFTITSLQVLPQNPTAGARVALENRWTFQVATNLGFTVTGLAITPFCNSTITLSPASLPTAAVNQPYSQQLTAGGGVAPYRFSVTAGALNAGLSLDPNTGQISGSPASATPATFTVTATDDNGCTGSQQYTLTPIVCPTITINPTNSTLPPGQVGSSYSQSFTQIGGAGLPFWTISAGALPAGLSLNSISGLLSGTPTAPGTFNFTVTATDSSGCTGTRAYTLVIGCPVVTVNPATLPNGFVGTAYNQTFTATGGAGPYSFTRVTGTLPPGLTLATGGTLAGVPTTEGTYNFTVQATDAAGCTGTRAYTVAIGGNGLMFYPLDAPVRALETRPGLLTGCVRPEAAIAAGTTFTLGVVSACTGIPANARAIAGNITVVPTFGAGGYLTLFPSNAAQPIVANSNFKPLEVTNNVFTVGLGPADGAFKIFASATTHVIVDVTGYFAPPSPTGLYFHPLNEPVRFVETRTIPGLPGCIKPGAPFPVGTTEVQGRSPIASPCNVIPSSARVLVGNATTIFPSTGGFLTIWPSDAAQPTVAASNYAGGDVINGPFTVKLGADGKFKVFTNVATNLVIDVLGYYSEEPVDANGAGLLFTPLPKPIRELETRPDFPGFPLTGCFRTNAPIQGGTESIRTQPIWGTCDGITIPNVARAIMGNVTVVLPPINGLSTGYLTGYPGNVGTPPTVATSNYPIPATFGYNRFFVVGLSPADGTFKIFTSATTDVILDVSGYFAP